MAAASRPPVPSALVESFRSDLRCDDAVARVLAELARERIPGLGGSTEDSDEDLVLRLREPRIFGAFVGSALHDSRVPPAARTALLEHVFDLLSVPRTEAEVIAVEARAPRNLLQLARELAATEGLSILHIMHLVYAIFLDRSLLADAPRHPRTDVFRAVMTGTDSGEGLRTLYAGLHLATVPPEEAVRELRWVLRASAVPLGTRRSLAEMAASGDGGQASMARLAQREGLLAVDVGEAQAAMIAANIPRLPEKLAAAGRRFLKRRGGS